MSSTKMVVRSLPLARKLAFKLMREGKFKQASDMAGDVLLQIPKRVKTPDVEALHVIAAVSYYLSVA